MSFHESPADVIARLEERDTRRRDIIARILANVSIEPGPLVSPCWIWQGSTSGDGRGGGYPRMSLDGQTVAVHRVIAVCVFGYVPGKKQVDHKCRARLCCNPEHHEIVTPKVNATRRSAAARELSQSTAAAEPGFTCEGAAGEPEREERKAA